MGRVIESSAIERYIAGLFHEREHAIASRDHPWFLQFFVAHCRDEKFKDVARRADLIRDVSDSARASKVMA